MEQLPALILCHCVYNLLEEINIAGTSDNQTFSAEHDHLPEILINDFLETKLVWLIRFDHKEFALSVERIDFISCF